jgi:tetratricopeptide (TPR) repeat protein
MQIANDETVLGDFGNAKFSYRGVESTFFRRADRFFVNTDGPDGKLHDYEIQYTFGVTPLQQYLIAFPGGRYQALSIAWDTRPKERGGQRWFHLYPNERIDHRDELHWTGLQQNWNYMCADCHSTNLKKNYDAATDTYKTSWSELNVSCEACHGPGSRHVAWAREGKPDAGDGAKGLTVRLDERRGVSWKIDAASGNARRSAQKTGNAEIEMCAQCHARRGQIAGDYEAGRPFLDHYLPALLAPPLYHVDGQQRDEVYNWGSFLQSRMYAHGVTCSDCHDPHSGKLRAPGNAVCGQCHAPQRYDAAAHHHHQPGKAGAQCAACHMPTATYMVIDPRHDHSLRVPRPDLTISLGVPNACNPCHRDKRPKWAADQVAKWYGHVRGGFQKFAPALHAASQGLPDAIPQLQAVLTDEGQPEIARASAALAMSHIPDPASVAAARQALGDGGVLVRHAALSTLEFLPPEQRTRLAAPLLDDPVRIVRMEATRVLAPVPAAAFTPAQEEAFSRAAAEYEAAQRFNADRPEHRTNLGSFFAQRGRPDEAEAEFRAALKLQPAYVPAYVNLADLRRAQGRDREAESVLREGLKVVLDKASLHHALGLTLARLQRMREAIRELARAVALEPGQARFSYVYAVALNSTGRQGEARKVLDQALARNPGDRDLLIAAATSSRDAGDRAAALRYAERLAARSPADPAARQLLEELRPANAGP